MINLKIKYNDTTAGIEFPCSDSTIASKLMELHASDHEGDPFFVEEVIEPKEFTSFFEHRFIDLDEVNYLAKRMDGLSGNELVQFFAAIRQEGHLTPKDLINTTFNLGRYTLIRDLTDMHKVGVTHTLNVKGAITPEEQNSPYMETVGKELICSGKGIPTEFGLVFINEEIEFAEEYDGTTFPEYYYKDSVATAYLYYGDKKECLYLPEDGLAIGKALRRLGCESLDECDSEYERFCRMAEATKRTNSDLVRRLLQTSVFVEFPPVEYREIIDQLEHIGINLNQLAYKANSLGFIDELQYRKNANAVWRMVAQLAEIYLQVGARIDEDIRIKKGEIV